MKKKESAEMTILQSVIFSEEERAQRIPRIVSALYEIFADAKKTR